MTCFLLKSTRILARAVHLIEVIVDEVIISLCEYVGSLVYKCIVFKRHKELMQTDPILHQNYLKLLNRSNLTHPPVPDILYFAETLLES